MVESAKTLVELLNEFFRVQCQNLFDFYSSLTRNMTKLQQVSNASTGYKDLRDRILKLKDIFILSGCDHQMCRALQENVPSERNSTTFYLGDNLVMNISALK